MLVSFVSADAVAAGGWSAHTLLLPADAPPSPPVHAPSSTGYWKCNFPKTHHIRLSVGLWVGPFVMVVSSWSFRHGRFVYASIGALFYLFLFVVVIGRCQLILEIIRNK